MNAYERYRAKTLVPLQIALNRNTDSDILQWLDGKPSKAGAVKAAIRAQMLLELAPAPLPEVAPAPLPEPAPAPLPEITLYDNLDDVPVLTERQKAYRLEWVEKRNGVRECACYAVVPRLMTVKRVRAAFLEQRPKDAPHAFRLGVTGSISH